MDARSPDSDRFAAAGDIEDGRIAGPFDVSLRPLVEADLPNVMRWLAEPEVVRFYGDPPTDLDEARRDYVEPDAGAPMHRYVIEWTPSLGEHKEHGAPRDVGEIQWYHPYHDEATHWDSGVDIFIGEPDARGHGVGIEAVRVMLRYLFEVKRVHRVLIDPEVGNERAIHVYQRAGFHLDGVVRHAAFEHGEYVDTQYLTALEDEWPAIRARWAAERGPIA